MRGREFAELRAFAAIVEHGSFVRAAAYLGISASTLSATLRQLEERLGVRLLNRTTRSVAVTVAGERLFQRLSLTLNELEEAVTEAANSNGQPSGILRLNVSRVAAIVYLAPLLGDFLQAFPEIHVDLVTDDRLVDIVSERFDAGIRLGEKLHQDMVAIPLTGDLTMKVVASPSYLARHGTPKHPRELVDHRCLTYRRPSDGSVYRWEFEHGAQRLEVAVQGPLIVDEPAMLTAIACAGSGIGYQFSHQVDGALTEGRLVQLLPEWTPSFPGFYVYYPCRRQMAAPLRAFLDFLSERRVIA